MAKNLLIVESPAKAKTIEKFLGKDFKVTSSQGHIRDLVKGNKAIKIKENYQPVYDVSPDKEKIVTELRKLAKSAEEVWLATDEDREGEAISWHLCEVLKLDPKTAKRIVFHEITKPAIQHAVENPRSIDLNLVNAQQARRVLDRLVGFELSPLLWRKVSVKSALSAGRVQSVAVRLIVEREREIQQFVAASSFKVNALFDVADAKGKQTKLKAELPKKIDVKEQAEKFLNEANGAVFTVKDIQTKPAKKTPSAPFTTSTLQQEAARKLYFSVSKTMMIAQKLYESGFITYMRTDSTNLSETAIEASAAEIKKSYGDKYVQTRRYKTKSGSAQEAHEAIRPTYFENHTIDGNSDEQRLYELIWKRAVASQMADAELERTTVRIDISTNHEELTASGEVLIFDGFLTLYMESVDEDNQDEESSGILPPIKAGDILPLDYMAARERFTKAPPRYAEASLVKKLEELGIGRPSTYAPTISTIQKREYVVKKDKEGVERKYAVITLKNGNIVEQTETEITGAEKNKLFPTDVGSLVNDFLTQHFNDVMDYGFTASIEQQFDEIAEGKIVWNKMIDNFYKPFHADVEKTADTAARVTGERLLGEDPATGKPVYAKIGRFGPMIQIGATDSEEKPRFSKMKATQSVETITLEEAMLLFRLPRTLGTYEEQEVVANDGRFGPYIKFGALFISLKKLDPHEVTMEQAIELIEAKKESEANKHIASFEDGAIQVLNGMYGPYIKSGKNNYKIPKGTDPKALTLEEIQEIIKTTPEKKKRKFTPRKKKGE
jgi:DNA topoisomerase-1